MHCHRNYENRPVSIVAQGLTTTMVYGPDGERWSKATASATAPTMWFIGSDVELLKDTINPAGLYTSQLSGSTRQTGVQLR
jgi:hypothetical protein